MRILALGTLGLALSLGMVGLGSASVVGDADGVTVVEREKAAALMPLAAEKVAAETRRIADIQSRKALRPAWLDGALRAAGVIGDGETL